MIKVFTVRCQGRNCGTVEQLSATAFIRWSFLSHYLERRKEQSSFKEEVRKEEINVRKIEVPFFINTYVCTCYYVPRLLPFGRISSQSFQKMNVLLIVRRAFSRQCSIKLLRLHICIGFAYYYKNRGVLGYTWMKSTLAFMYFDTLWKWFCLTITCAIHPKKFKV